MPAKKPHLSVAPPNARASRKPPPKNISEALDGSARDVLVAMRKALAKKLDDGEVSSNAIASAYKELRELDRLIGRAQTSPLPASFRALADARAVRGDPRVRAALDSLDEVEREVSAVVSRGLEERGSDGRR